MRTEEHLRSDVLIKEWQLQAPPHRPLLFHALLKDRILLKPGGFRLYSACRHPHSVKESIHNSPVSFAELPFLHLLFTPIKRAGVSQINLLNFSCYCTDYHQQTEPPLSKNWDFGALISWI